MNEQVVSVSYWSQLDAEGRRRVMSFTTWDGESYADEFFCKGSCAMRFAYVMARAGKCTVAYNEALERQAAAA